MILLLLLLLLLLLGGNNAILNRTIKSGAKFIRDSLISSLQLQEYPRKIIVIKVCILRDDGAMFAVALNAASLALMNSGKIQREKEDKRNQSERGEEKRREERRRERRREERRGEEKRRVEEVNFSAHNLFFF